MSESPRLRPCPYIGLHDDASVIRSSPTASHRCYAQTPAAPVPVDYQAATCFTAAHGLCPYYVKQPVTTAPAAFQPVQRAPRKQAAWLASALALLLLVGAGLVGFIYAGDLLRSPAGQAGEAQSPAAVISIVAAATADSTSTATPVPSLEATEVAPEQVTAAQESAAGPGLALAAQAVDGGQAQQAAALPPVAAVVRPQVAVQGDFRTPTPYPDGQVLVLQPAADEVGWWASNETRRNHIGDSFLYSGNFNSQTYIAAARFDLSRVARGAPIYGAMVRLTGLRDDRFVRDAGASWIVQLLAGDALPDMQQADFLTAFSAPASITLPLMAEEDLVARQVNTWELDQVTREWLEQQLLDGATSVTVRLLPNTGNPESLFAWDSGAGPETAGYPPQLVLSLGAPPPTPPPLPTKPFIVATLTPVPENALTAVAMAATATSVAETTGTYTPVPYQVHTPTPFPLNLATVQAGAATRGLPAVALQTPTPASEAEATGNAVYATAVALTTGTFTPVPPDYVTPVVVLPSPPAENLATEAARIVAATAMAEAAALNILPTPTFTPLPYNAVIAEYVYATGVPENAATAAALAVIAEANAKVKGTPTPLPWNAVVITRVPTPLPTQPPTPTPIPLIVMSTDFTPTPTPTEAGPVPTALPPELKNKIIFKSDRSGKEEVYALDPATGGIALITQGWVYPLAAQQTSISPDGAQQAIVKVDANGVLQVQIYTPQYNKVQQVTGLRGSNYDPAWSPAGNLIAFVSTETGGDEIFTTDLGGQIITRLTFNTWEWDKHPSWSPDGSQIVFYSNRETGRRQLWVMKQDGTGQRNLSSNEYNDWDPVWTR